MAIFNEIVMPSIKLNLLGLVRETHDDDVDDKNISIKVLAEVVTTL